MDDFEAMVSYYLDRLADPSPEKAGNAEHGLIDVGEAVLPWLIRRFAIESDGRVRSRLVHVAWETRSQAAMPFLERALGSRDPDVWKEALDGLVTLGGWESRAVLERARHITHGDKLAWLDEALGQIDDGTGTGDRNAS